MDDQQEEAVTPGVQETSLEICEIVPAEDESFVLEEESEKEEDDLEKEQLGDEPDQFEDEPEPSGSQHSRRIIKPVRKFEAGEIPKKRVKRKVMPMFDIHDYYRTTLPAPRIFNWKERKVILVTMTNAPRCVAAIPNYCIGRELSINRFGTEIFFGPRNDDPARGGFKGLNFVDMPVLFTYYDTKVHRKIDVVAVVNWWDTDVCVVSNSTTSHYIREDNVQVKTLSYTLKLPKIHEATASPRIYGLLVFEQGELRIEGGTPTETRPKTIHEALADTTEVADPLPFLYHDDLFLNLQLANGDPKYPGLPKKKKKLRIRPKQKRAEKEEQKAPKISQFFNSTLDGEFKLNGESDEDDSDVGGGCCYPGHNFKISMNASDSDEDLESDDKHIDQDDIFDIETFADDAESNSEKILKREKVFDQQE